MSNQLAYTRYMRVTHWACNHPMQDVASTWINALDKNGIPTKKSKSCPKAAFTHLCKAGIVGNFTVTQGTVGSRYGTNCIYVINALLLLRKYPTLQTRSPNSLWRRIGQYNNHNNQMDVAIALFVGNFYNDSQLTAVAKTLGLDKWIDTI